MKTLAFLTILVVLSTLNLNACSTDRCWSDGDCCAGLACIQEVCMSANDKEK